jgi:hypothetical protein
MPYTEFSPAIMPGDPRYIEPGECPLCEARAYKGIGYVCTLDAGHKGPHVAHGSEAGGSAMYAKWDNRKVQKKKERVR